MLLLKIFDLFAVSLVGFSFTFGHPLLFLFEVIEALFDSCKIVVALVLQVLEGWLSHELIIHFFAQVVTHLVDCIEKL